MHIGADTDFYLRKGFRVVAVEANPDLAARCQHRFRSEGDAGQLPGERMSFETAMNFYRTFYFKVKMMGLHTGLFRSVRNRYLKRALGRIFHPGAGWYDTHATR